jgi:hypothetical protein
MSGPYFAIVTAIGTLPSVNREDVSRRPRASSVSHRATPSHATSLTWIPARATKLAAMAAR